MCFKSAIGKAKSLYEMQFTNYNNQLIFFRLIVVFSRRRPPYRSRLMGERGKSGHHREA